MSRRWIWFSGRDLIRRHVAKPAQSCQLTLHYSKRQMHFFFSDSMIYDKAAILFNTLKHCLETAKVLDI